MAVRQRRATNWTGVEVVHPTQTCQRLFPPGSLGVQVVLGAAAAVVAVAVNGQVGGVLVMARAACVKSRRGRRQVGLKHLQRRAWRFGLVVRRRHGQQ